METVNSDVRPIGEQDQLSWEEFARKIKADQIVHDPNGHTSRRKSVTFSPYTREQISGWLKSPTSSEKQLRDASIYMYQTDSRYRNLLNYYADIPCWLWTMTAVRFNPDRSRPDAFRRQYIKACNLIESLDVKRTMRDITLVALREGAYFGVIWGGDGNSFILQKLNPDKCAIVSVGDGGVFNFAYDMSSIQEVDIDSHYPPAFRTMFNTYKAGGDKWQLVPSDVSVCLKADATIPEYAIPPFSAVLPALFYVRNAEDLAETADELQNYKLLSAQLPVDDNGKPTMDYKTAMKYYDHISQNLADMVGLCLSPFKIEDHDFQQSAASTQVDMVGRSMENFFASAGTSALLHGVQNSTSAVTRMAAGTDCSYAFDTYVYQCESIANRLLRNQSGTQKFKINFLPVNIFNRDEMLGKYKEALNYGIGKLEYIACLGIPQYDILNKSYIENEVLELTNNLVPLKTAATQSADANDRGRPVKSDEELSDAGEASRDDQ